MGYTQTFRNFYLPAPYPRQPWRFGCAVTKVRTEGGTWERRVSQERAGRSLGRWLLSLGQFVEWGCRGGELVEGLWGETVVLTPTALIWRFVMAPHSRILALKIPWMEEPGGLQSVGSLRVGHDWATSLSLFTFMHWRREWQLTPVFLPGESQGWGSLVGCRLWGRTESDTTEAT